MVDYKEYMKRGFDNLSITWAFNIWIPKKVVGKIYSLGETTQYGSKFIAEYCKKYDCRIKETYEGELKDIENEINEKDRTEEDKKVNATKTYYKFLEYMKNAGETPNRGSWFGIGEAQTFFNDECGFDFDEQQTYNYIKNYWYKFHLVDSVYDDDFNWEFYAEGKKMKKKSTLMESISMEEDLFDEFRKWFKKEARKNGDSYGDEFNIEDVEKFLMAFGIDHHGVSADNDYILDLLDDWELLGLIEIRDFNITINYGKNAGTKTFKRYIIL